MILLKLVLACSGWVRLVTRTKREKAGVGEKKKNKKKTRVCSVMIGLGQVLGGLSYPVDDGDASGCVRGDEMEFWVVCGAG